MVCRLWWVAVLWILVDGWPTFYIFFFPLEYVDLSGQCVGFVPIQWWFGLSVDWWWVGFL